MKGVQIGLKHTDVGKSYKHELGSLKNALKVYYHV